MNIVRTFPATGEELPHDEHLQARHRYHQPALDQAKIEDPLLRTPNRAEVPVFARAEVLLLPGEGGHLAGELEDRLLDTAELLGRGASFLRQLRADFVLDLRKVSETVRVVDVAWGGRGAQQSQSLPACP